MISLQTKSVKYCKLINGESIKVHHQLVKKMKNQIQVFFEEENERFQITAILGLNGSIYIGIIDRELKNEEN